MTEADELKFYKRFFQSMNATAYLLQIEPYRVSWVKDNDHVERITGFTAAQIMDQGDQITSLLPRLPDFDESVLVPTEEIRKNPDVNWGGVFRIKKQGAEAYSWVIYSSGIFELTPEGVPDKLACIGISLDDILHTPETLKVCQQYINHKINQEKIESLSDRQREVLQLIQRGATRKDIAKQLGISIYTVEDHKRALYKNLDCKNMPELSAKAAEIGLN